MGDMAYREFKNPPCKIVYVVLGDGEISEWIEDVKIAVKNNLPIILVKGTTICDKMIGYINEKTKFYNGGEFYPKSYPNRNGRFAGEGALLCPRIRQE